MRIKNVSWYVEVVFLIGDQKKRLSNVSEMMLLL